MRHFVKIKGGRWRSSGFYFSNRLPSVLDTLDTSGRNKKKSSMEEMEYKLSPDNLRSRFRPLTYSPHHERIDDGESRQINAGEGT